MIKLLNFSCIPAICVFLLNCNNTNDNNNYTNVNYMVSEYHFVKNTITSPTDSCILLINSYHAFDSLFGTTYYSGMDTSKLITESKMSNSFVISIFYHGNNIHGFSINGIYKDNNILIINYNSSITNPNATWTCNCHKTVLINNTDYDSIQFIENGNLLSDIQILNFQ